MRPLVQNLENWIACDIFSKLSLFLYYFYNRLQYTKNAFVAVFGRFLEVFYALKDSFKYFLQLVYAISSTYSSCLFERTVVQEVPMWIYGLFVIYGPQVKKFDPALAIRPRRVFDPLMTVLTAFQCVLLILQCS